MLEWEGVHPNIICSDGRVPLHDAAERGEYEICKDLIAEGADVKQVNWFKTTPLHLAAEYGRLECVELLLENGAEIDFQDNDGYTPLHRAAQNNRREIVQFLIANKANHLILNNDGLKAFEIAPEPLNKELTEFVIENFMAKSRAVDPEPPLLTPGRCVFCQSADPVIAYRPCPHIQLCDDCYINHKEVLKICPMCKKNLKRVEFLNPPPEPEPIEEDPPEPEPEPEPPKHEEEEEKEEQTEKPNEEEDKTETGSEYTASTLDED